MDEQKKTSGSLALNSTPRVITIAPSTPVRDRKLRVAAYARVSSRSEDQLNSFAAQNAHYTEPGGDPPGLLPTNKAGALKVAKENYQPDIIDILVHNQPSFQREATPNRQGAASASYFGFPKAIIPHLYSTLLPQVSGRQQTDCAGAHHGNLTPPRISPSCPHCLIPVSPGAVAGQEYHYQIADEGRAG